MSEMQVAEEDTDRSVLNERDIERERRQANEFVIKELAKLDLEIDNAGSMALSRVPGEDEIYVSG